MLNNSGAGIGFSFDYAGTTGVVPGTGGTGPEDAAAGTALIILGV